MSPVLPPELHRDVLFWAVGPYARGLLPTGPQHAALASDKERERDRRELRDRRMTVIQVCRAWKREARKYLYRDPHLPSLPFFASLAQSLLRADKMWDDLRSSPHSLPGAYVQTLDLSHVAASSSTTSDSAFNPWRFTSTLSTILPLIPSLTRLVLPSPENYMLGATTLLRLLVKADFDLASIKELENVPVFADGVLTSEGLDPIAELLLALPNIERLSVVGGGVIDLQNDQTPAGDGNDLSPLHLPRLKSLSFRGVPSGLLLRNLIASDLPGLRDLEISSYHSHLGDLTTPFLAAHGYKLKSLTFLHLPDFPALNFSLPESTLEDCPQLVSLSFHALSSLASASLPAFFGRPAYHLKQVTLPRPPRATSTAYNDLITHICTTPNLPALKTLSVSPGFTWLATQGVSAPLYSPIGGGAPSTSNGFAVSPAATHAGLNGLMRQYAVRLGRRGVQVLDARGRGCPGLTALGGGGWGTPKDVGGLGAKGAARMPEAWRERRQSVQTEDGEESEGGG